VPSSTDRLKTVLAHDLLAHQCLPTSCMPRLACSCSAHHHCTHTMQYQPVHPKAAQSHNVHMHAVHSQAMHAYAVHAHAEKVCTEHVHTVSAMMLMNTRSKINSAKLIEFMKINCNFRNEPIVSPENKNSALCIFPGHKIIMLDFTYIVGNSDLYE
jgi:hypothetical protein